MGDNEPTVDSAVVFFLGGAAAGISYFFYKQMKRAYRKEQRLKNIKVVTPKQLIKMGKQNPDSINNKKFIVDGRIVGS